MRVVLGDSFYIKGYTVEGLIKTLTAKRWWQRFLWGKNRCQAADYIGRCDPKAYEAVPYLIEILKNSKEEPMLRSTCARSLASIHDEKAIPELIQVLENEENIDVKKSIMQTLGDFGEKAKGAKPKLVSILKNSKDNEIRYWAIRVIGWILAREEIQTLKNLMLNDEDGRIRSGAAFALGEMNAKQVLNDVILAIQDKKNDNYMFEFAIGLMLLEEKRDGSGAKILEEMERRGMMHFLNLAKYRSFYQRLPKKKETSQFDLKKIILEFIKREEGQKLEFKTYFRYNSKIKKESKESELKVIEAIVAFLNTEGGIILIGVNNSKEIIGIENDYLTFGKKQRNRDGFKLRSIRVIEEKIGIKYKKFIDINFENILGKDVCIITISKSTEPVYIYNNFIIRVGNRNKKLNTREAIDYIDHHQWNK